MAGEDGMEAEGRTTPTVRRSPSPTVVVWLARAAALVLAIGSGDPLLTALAFIAGGWEGVGRAAQWDERVIGSSEPTP
jgi:hypothetical protein